MSERCSELALGEILMHGSWSSPGSTCEPCGGSAVVAAIRPFTGHMQNYGPG